MKKYLICWLLACLTTAPAWGESPTAQPAAELKPYLQVKPVAGEGQIIRVFYSPRCPYSMQYLPFFNNLAATVPKGSTLEFTPLVNKGDGLSYALAFLAVRRYAPAYVRNFVTASLTGVQEKGLVPSSWAGIDRIGRAAGLRESIPGLVNLHRATLKADLAQLLDLQKALGITNTPSVAVAGTYIVTPEFTRGDVKMFNQLINAVISMTYFGN